LLVEVFEIKDGEQKVKFIIKRKDADKRNWIEDEIYIKSISKMIDLHETYGNKGERIDIFYGKDRVYVSLRKSKEARKKFANFVQKTKE
jgi:nucleoid-associated protein YejK